MTDKKIGHDAGNGTIDYYLADVISAQDYYPGGMLMPGRTYSNGSSYKYGFAGKEKDNEAKGEGNQYDFGNRVYDPRVVRWYSTDRVVKPWLSSYQYASGNPVNLADPDGGDEIHFHYITVRRNVSFMARCSDGKYREQTATIATTYKYAQIIADNNKDRFFVHRQDVGKSETIEFYPNSAERTKSGVTSTSYLFGAFSLKDNDYESMQKISDDFPGLKGEVLRPEVESANSGWSQHNENRNWWNNFYGNLDFKKQKEAEQAQVNNLMLGIVIGAAAELLIADVILAARGSLGLTEKFFSSAIQPSKNGLTTVGRALQKHADREGSSFSEIIWSGKTGDQQGLDVLKEILGSKNQFIDDVGNGTKTIFDKTTGRGVNVSRSGEFNGFRDIKEIKK